MENLHFGWELILLFLIISGIILSLIIAANYLLLVVLEDQIRKLFGKIIKEYDKRRSLIYKTLPFVISSLLVLIIDIIFLIEYF